MDILNIEEHIRTLEELLLHQDFSLSPEALDAMLSQEFKEVNPDGVVVPRESVINWLRNKDQAARWEFKEFEVRMLAPGLAQATYHARQIAPQDKLSKGAVHCSIWRENSVGEVWELLFHQSTRVR
jgi:hypothetical protein